MWLVDGGTGEGELHRPVNLIGFGILLRDLENALLGVAGWVMEVWLWGSMSDLSPLSLGFCSPV